MAEQTVLDQQKHALPLGEVSSLCICGYFLADSSPDRVKYGEIFICLPTGIFIGIKLGDIRFQGHTFISSSVSYPIFNMLWPVQRSIVLGAVFSVCKWVIIVVAGHVSVSDLHARNTYQRIVPVQYRKKHGELCCFLDSNSNQVPSANSFSMAKFRQVDKNLNHDKVS